MVNRYYHYICNDFEKEIYATILEGLMEYQEIINFDNSAYISPALVGQIFKMVLYDNPRIFYTSTQGYQIGINSSKLFLIPKYFFGLQAILELQKWLDERVAEICSPIIGVKDDFSKEIYIHNYLAENIRYSHSAVAQPINAYTVAGTLLENNSVCAGIALSFKLLMDYLNIQCIAATGTATNNAGITERHAWNIVYVDGAYYQIDVTWDLLDGQNDRVIKYDYFNLTTSEMYKTRVADYEYPICAELKCNYFSYMNAVVSSPDELLSFVSNCIRNGESRIYFKYTFDQLRMKNNIHKYLKKICLMGRYKYWVNEEMQTVFILRGV